MSDKETLSDILGEREHSWLLLGTLNAINANHSFLNRGRIIAEDFKQKVEEMVPDCPDVSIEDMTPGQIQASIAKGNALAAADNLLEEINKS